MIGRRMVAAAVNHMTAPSCAYDDLLRMAKAIGCVGVEFRNDLPGPLFCGDDPAAVKAAAEGAGLRILALAEVKTFNDWSDAKRAEAAALIEIAKACGAEAVSLIPRNDGFGLGEGERQANLRVALKELKPMLEAVGLIGPVEPLGFACCSLRYKAEAVDVIEALGAADVFKLVHDTFHHTLAGGPLFPDHTGVVHISGVVDPEVAFDEMTDAHRVLVTSDDRLGNIEQLHALAAAGYAGPVSFEAFSPEVHALAEPESAIAKSFAFIRSALTAREA